MLDRAQSCEYASYSALFTVFTEHLNAEWPGSRSIVKILPTEMLHRAEPGRLDTPSFSGVVKENGRLETRFVRKVKRKDCFIRVLVRIPLGDPFLSQLTNAAGLKIVDSRPMKLMEYRQDEGLAGEIEANFMPGSSRAVPVIVVARNWETGFWESWVICEIRLAIRERSKTLAVWDCERRHGCLR